MFFSAKLMARRAVRLWPLIAIIIVTILGTIAYPYLSISWRKIGINARPRITSVIYPTFGNPVIAKKGTGFTVEFDTREQSFKDPIPRLENFGASVTTSNGRFPVTMRLPVDSVDLGYSTHWPEYSRSPSEDRRMYIATISIPMDIPSDLYDLTVRAQETDGGWIEDTQPHALSAVDEFKDQYSFCQLTDIHLYGPEVSDPFRNMHERSERSDGSDPGRQGPLYYEKTVDQVNLMHPDFCVYTGDHAWGQSYFAQDQGGPWGWLTEYAYEQLWFYEETLKLDVPVFMGMGNHDSYAEGGEGAHEDWVENWRKLFGPSYFSFDYGDSHFLMLNAQDWPVKDRILNDYPFAIQPNKTKGQFLGGGDAWGKGVTEARLDAIDESKLTGQLAWMRDDLRAHMNSRIRVCATHEDPWLADGQGVMWATGRMPTGGFLNSVSLALGFAGVYGNGAGRLASVKLMRDYMVSLTVSGHFHSDNVGALPWKDETGAVLFVNTTSVQFDRAGLSKAYPGYRRIWVSGGQVASVNYVDPKWSYPTYRGTNVGGMTDLDKLTVPAVLKAFKTTPGVATEASLAFDNSLATAIPLAFCEISMPCLTGGHYYEVLGGSVSEVQDVGVAPLFGGRILGIYTDVPRSAVKTVTVKGSQDPDNIAPTGTLAINGGAAVTPTAAVTLDMTARDDVSGVRDIQISNSPDFKDARWQKAAPRLPWHLKWGPAGERTVYMRVRDMAMPPNLSGAIGAKTICQESTDLRPTP